MIHDSRKTDKQKHMIREKAIPIRINYILTPHGATCGQITHVHSLKRYDTPLVKILIMNVGDGRGLNLRLCFLQSLDTQSPTIILTIAHADWMQTCTHLALAFGSPHVSSEPNCYFIPSQAIKSAFHSVIYPYAVLSLVINLG